MAAGANDKFLKVGVAGTLTSLSAPGHSVSGTTITVGSTTNWPTDTATVFAIRQVDSSGSLVAGTYTEWRGIVSGSTLTNMTLMYGTDQVYPAGSTTQVYIPLSAAAHNRLIDGILSEHDQDGTHGAITASSITATTGTFDSVVVSGTATSQGWTPLGDVPDTVTANGNRNYDLVFNGVDHTSTLSPGMKLQLSRTVAAPDQCADLEASSSQYFSKTSPNGMTFTDDFTVSAWIKLESYAAGTIVSRYNGTNGWIVTVNASGQLTIQGFNGGSQDYATAYASLPLNKWTHVAATLDISGATATMYIDGVSVANAYTNGAPTAITQAGNLEIGSQNGGSTYFDGKISQVAIFSSVLSAATIRSYMSQGLSGSESTLVSAYSLDNTLNDLSANANNLTANGGAAATATDSPFANAVAAGTLEYAEVNSVTFSTNTTVNVRVPDTCQIPTSGGISAVSYSTQSNPYGLPYFSKILGSQIIQSSQTTTSTLTDRFSIPVYVPANARLRATLVIPTAKDSGASGGTSSRIFQDGTSVTYSIHYPLAANTEMRHNTTTILEPTPGTHTYTVSMNEVGGVGTATFGADSTYPIRFWVELV